MTSTEGIVVQELLTQEDKVAWDTFVYTRPDSLPFHQTVWKDIMQASYGYPCHFLFARQRDLIAGVLPLFQVNSIVKGRSLQSLPGAVCAMTPDVALALIYAADTLANDLRTDYFLLRDSRYNWSDSNLEVVEAHRGVRRSLSYNSEWIWKELPRDVRYDVRNGKKQANLRIVFGQDGLDEFYTFLHHLHQQLGTPLFGKKFLQQIAKFLEGNYQVVRVYLGNILIAGFFNFIFKQQVFGMWGGALSEYRKYKVTHQAFWAMTEHACQSGFTIYDLNRSIFPSGQYNFKASWGDITYPIYQLYRSNRDKIPVEIQASLKRSRNQGVDLSSAVWQRLPFSVTGILGPIIRRHIPFG
jgi:FemAB-related protein (PEP-CTERM system-associated)